MKVFLTGATGFVGSHLVPRLLADGHDVRALVRDPSAAKAKLGDKVQLVHGDAVTGQGIAGGIVGCDSVIHLIGIIMESRGATFEMAHVATTRNILMASQAAGVRRWVQMSAL